MLQANEVITLLLAVGALIFVWGNRRSLKHIPAWKVLLAVLCMYSLGWTLTIVEHFCLPDLLDMVENGVYAAGSLALAVWCWQALGRGVA